MRGDGGIEKRRRRVHSCLSVRVIRSSFSPLCVLIFQNAFPSNHFLFPFDLSVSFLLSPPPPLLLLLLYFVRK